MFANHEQNRVLIVSVDDALSQVFTYSTLEMWKLVEADSFPRALLVQQSNPCDVLLVDESVFLVEGIEGLLWVIRQQTAPVLLLGDLPEDIVAQAFQEGLSLWLPRSQTIERPQLLSGALWQGKRLSTAIHNSQRYHHSLEQCQKQVDRLVSLLWRTGQLEAERRWHAYRFMLERLDEELNRAQRYDLPLTVALGEMTSEDTAAQEEGNLMYWAAERISRFRRRSDVIGQYGLHGLMIVMSHTSKDGGMLCCKRLKNRLEEPDPDRSGPIRAYFGLASLSSEVRSPQTLLRLAEDRLEAAKQKELGGIVGA